MSNRDQILQFVVGWLDRHQSGEIDITSPDYSHFVGILTDIIYDFQNKHL